VRPRLIGRYFGSKEGPFAEVVDLAYLDRMLLGHTELNSPGTENLVPYLHAALDAVAKAPEPAPRS
jgi:hypothetical protein